jgi:hypothetical protein
VVAKEIVRLTRVGGRAEAISAYDSGAGQNARIVNVPMEEIFDVDNGGEGRSLSVCRQTSVSRRETSIVEDGMNVE